MRATSAARPGYYLAITAALLTGAVIGCSSSESASGEQTLTDAGQQVDAFKDSPSDGTSTSADAADASADNSDVAAQPDAPATQPDAQSSDAESDSAAELDAADAQVQFTVVDLGIADYSAGKKGAFARNPWDMTYFEGRLYIGQGNSDNEGSPDTNAGPVKITSLVPGQTGFQYEGASGAATLPEEQIDVIRIADGALFIPGHDPRLEWTIRTVYKRTTADAAWTQYQSTNATIGDSWGVHNYDVVGFDNKLFSGGYAFGISVDGGQTWTDAGASSRCSAFLTVNGKLYGATFEGLGLYEYAPATQKFFKRTDLSPAWSNLLPGIQLTDPAASSLKIVRAIAVGKASIYLGGYTTSDHQTGTTDVFLAKSLEKNAIDVTRTTPPGERPWDLLVRGTTAYLLTSAKTGTGASEKFTVSIWQSAPDYSNWSKLYSIADLSTFARSFEEVSQDFYLGLGTDDGTDGYTPADTSYTTGVKDDSGRILMLRH